MQSVLTHRLTPDFKDVASCMEGDVSSLSSTDRVNERERERERYPRLGMPEQEDYQHIYYFEAKEYPQAIRN